MTKFVDKKNVYVLSTVDKAGEVDKERILPGNHRISYKKPIPVERYYENIGGVDKTDQVLAASTYVHKSFAWFKKFGISMMERLILNAYLRFRNEKNSKMKFFGGQEESCDSSHWY